jgi:hypothetical protein
MTRKTLAVVLALFLILILAAPAFASTSVTGSMCSDTDGDGVCETGEPYISTTGKVTAHAQGSSEWAIIYTSSWPPGVWSHVFSNTPDTYNFNFLQWNPSGGRCIGSWCSGAWQQCDYGPYYLSGGAMALPKIACPTLE